jgi:hypothetical protein
MTRRVLRDLQKASRVECLGRGPGARDGGKRVISLRRGNKKGNNEFISHYPRKRERLQRHRQRLKEP